MKKTIWTLCIISLLLFLGSCTVEFKLERAPKPIDDDPIIDEPVIDDPIVDPTIEPSIDEMIQQMTTEEKISQMIMIACRSRGGANFTSMKSEVASLLKAYPFAGFILFAQNCVTNDQTFRLIQAIQTANSEGDHPGLLIAVDQEGGRVTRLEEGTALPGNMALGASIYPEDIYMNGSIIGSELDALGFNVDFAPVADINNNPKNPVIGTRSFSDNEVKVSTCVAQYLQGLSDQNVIGCLKHFPGHGDTGTDSHTGLPLIDKSLDELLSFELYPYLENVSKIEMIMTAHIVYPQIETDTYISTSTGKSINLPATLSHTIITEVLREQLGYQGVVITDALEMAAIASHFEKLDVARLAINAGVDILLMPIDISTSNGINELKQYITDVAKLVDDGVINREMVDSAVKRILSLKDNHQLLKGAPSKDNTAIEIVGSKEHHTLEEEITKHTITLIKNDDALPISALDHVLIVAPTSLSKSLGYAFILTGKYMDVMPLELVSTDGFSFSYYDKVIILSQMGNVAYLKGSEATSITKLINKLHGQNKKVILLSCNLPYDVARFMDADAIVVCYGNRAMSTLPTESSKMKQYGPNIPMAILLMQGDIESFEGVLPVNIYGLNSSYNFTSEIIYPIGFNLNKKEE